MLNSATRVKCLRISCWRRWKFFVSLVGSAIVGSQANAQTTSLYFNNTINGVRNWGGNSGGNGFWASSPVGGTFRTVTTLNDLLHFNTNASNSGPHDIFTGAGQAANGMIFGVGPNSYGPFRIRASFNTNTSRDFNLGAGGITVNSNVQGVSFSNRDVTTGTLTGELNTLLSDSQTWTNNSAGTLDFSSRLVGSSAVTLTKAGTGTLILGGNNSAASIGGTTGYQGKIVVNQGTLIANHNNALETRDPLSMAMSVGEIITPVSGTSIAAGATLDTNNRQLGNEYITVVGSGVSGQGAIVNNASSTTPVFNTLAQVELLGNTSFGGQSFWEINAGGGNQGKLFLKGNTLTKTGSNTVRIVNSDVIGGGTILVNSGVIQLGDQTNFVDPTTISLSNSGVLSFTNFTGTAPSSIVVTERSLSPNFTQFSSIGSVDSVVTSSIDFVGKDSFRQAYFRSDSNRVDGIMPRIDYTGPMTNPPSDIFVYGSAVTGLNLPTGSDGKVHVYGQFDLLKDSSTNYTLSVEGTGPDAVSIGGEGKTTGILSLRNTHPFSLRFDPTTTGPTDHLRVGSFNSLFGPIPVVPTAPVTSGTGIVVLESSSNDINASSFTFNGRGVLSSTGTKLLLDYQAGNLVWNGSGGSGVWNKQLNNNWINNSTSNADVFYDGDIVTFNDSVGGTNATVLLSGAPSPQQMNVDNTNVAYTFRPSSTADRLSITRGTLVKSGSGTAVLETIAGGLGHTIESLEVQSGALEFGFNGNGTIVKSSVGSTFIRSGGTVRNSLNVPDVGIGESPIRIDGGGTFELTRGAIPNGTNTTPATIAVRSVFSGAGDIRLNGVQQSGFVDSFGDYSIAADNAGFSGAWRLNNARIRVDNLQGDEFGDARIVVPSGSQAYLTAGTTPYEGNTFEIAGTGWAYQPIADGGLGAIRFIADGATIAANSSIVLTDNARIMSSGITARIQAPISGSFGLEYGNPNGNQNGTIIVSGDNTYSGPTQIENHVIMANHNQAFGSGNVQLAGIGTARNTQISVANGVTIANPIFVLTTAGQNGRGAIEGGSSTQVSEKGAGEGILSGTITLAGNMAPDRAHFGSGGGAGSVLRITGPINITDPSTQAVSHRHSASGGYTQFEGGGGNYTRFELKGGTVRLGSNNGLNAGTDLITRTVADAATLDLNGFDQFFSSITAPSPVAGSSFRVINSSNNPSTLSLGGNGDSNLQDLPLGLEGGIINVVKTGSGILTIGGPGNGSGIQNTGRYAVNGGTLKLGDNISGSVAVNNARLVGGFRIAGSSNVSDGVIAPGNSIGTMTFGTDLVLSGDNILEFETSASIPTSGISRSIRFLWKARSISLVLPTS